MATTIATARGALIGIDLMPRAMKLTQLRRGRLRAWGIIITLASAVAGIPIGMEMLNQHRLAQAVKANEHRAQLLQAATQALRTVQTDAESYADQLAFSEALRAKRDWSRLLTLVAEVAGSDVWLASIQSESKTDRVAPPTAPTVPGEPANPTQEVKLEGPQSLVLEGYAADHSRLYQLMADLRDQGQLVEVDLSKAVMEPYGHGSAVRFRLECQW